MFSKRDKPKERADLLEHTLNKTHDDMVGSGEIPKLGSFHAKPKFRNVEITFDISLYSKGNKSCAMARVYPSLLFGAVCPRYEDHYRIINKNNRNASLVIKKAFKQLNYTLSKD